APLAAEQAMDAVLELRDHGTAVLHVGERAENALRVADTLAFMQSTFEARRDLTVVRTVGVDAHADNSPRPVVVAPRDDQRSTGRRRLERGRHAVVEQ
nr:hypothetical protein [Micromonospora sp. DSM 115978]